MVLSVLQCIQKCGESVPVVRETWDQITNIIRQLKSMKQNVNQLQTELLIEKKLPEWVRIKIEEAKADDEDNWNVKKLIKKVEKTLSVREQARSNAEETIQIENKLVEKNQRPNCGNLFATSNRGETRKNPMERRCLLCGNTRHFPSECPSYLTYGVRARRIQALNRCGRCLSREHNADVCRSKLKCPKCHGEGHCAVFCPKNFETCSSEQKSETTPDAKTITLNRIPFKKAGGATGGVCTIFGNYTGVKLPQTEAKISNPLNHNIVEDATILFDSASTFSFISRELACKLDLSTFGAKTHDLVVFGSQAPETKTFKQNIITMHHNGGRSHLILNETDYIIPDGISQVDNRKPDILIGADYFWDLVEGKRGTRKDGLVVLNSKLGPIVTGMTMKNSTNEAGETSGGRALPANQQQEIFKAW